VLACGKVVLLYGIDGSAGHIGDRDGYICSSSDGELYVGIVHGRVGEVAIKGNAVFGHAVHAQ